MKQENNYVKKDEGTWKEYVGKVANGITVLSCLALAGLVGRGIHNKVADHVSKKEEPKKVERTVERAPVYKFSEEKRKELLDRGLKPEVIDSLEMDLGLKMKLEESASKHAVRGVKSLNVGDLNKIGYPYASNFRATALRKYSDNDRIAFDDACTFYVKGKDGMKGGRLDLNTLKDLELIASGESRYVESNQERFRELEKRIENYR